VTFVVCLTLVERCDSGRMPDFGRISWLRSHFPTLVNVTTPVVSPYSGGASQLWSMSVPHVLPPQLWKTSHDRARWLQHLTARTLSQKQIERDASLVRHLKPQHLTALHVQESGHVLCDQQTLSPTWSERNLSIQKDSVPLQLGSINVFECLVRWAKSLYHVAMALRTSHTWKNS
jgi:hypothetical protein